MIERRAFLTGAAALSTTGGTPETTMAAEAAAVGEERDYSGLLTGIRDRIDRYGESATSVLQGIEGIREQQRIFIRSALKYPEYIDVGLSVWEAAYDWHVRWRQPLSITRQSDGTYHMAFMLSKLVLRASQTPNYVGPGYDK